MKSVLLNTTGGTIASVRGEEGLKPGYGSGELMRYVEGLNDHYRVETLELLNLDSSNIQIDEWISIARAIHKALPKYDGVVVTHGTDTMAYTASMVSFMLRGLKKPVVFTGSQMPIDNLLTDARNNLYTAFAAVDCGIPGVTIAFDRKIVLRTEKRNHHLEIFTGGMHGKGALGINRCHPARFSVQIIFHACFFSFRTGNRRRCDDDGIRIAEFHILIFLVGNLVYFLEDVGAIAGNDDKYILHIIGEIIRRYFKACRNTVIAKRSHILHQLTQFFIIDEHPAVILIGQFNNFDDPVDILVEQSDEHPAAAVFKEMFNLRGDTVVWRRMTGSGTAD